MTEQNTRAGSPSAVEELVARAADEFEERRARGERPDPEEYAARHPEAADLIREVLAVFDLLGGSARRREAKPGVAAPAESLGDYRIVREVGRGGMGVVYEAEQLSLPRRVALKVLPFAAVADPRHLQRFHNEARAAASLDHPNVVKVYGVGCERGVHFIAMQLIDGRSLAELICERRGSASPARWAGATRTSPGDSASTLPVGGRVLSSCRTPGDAAYFRRVAGWGAQAADALEHAHSLGVVHRDVKPANLLVDGRGELRVADFGLAKLAADPGVTGTGDLLGTARYMSPEQAAAKHDLVDHRSDVYSLGATLYELLTLTPAFDNPDRQAVLSQILSTDPAVPRSLDRSIPRDLETVILQAMSKEPARRYQSAGELAADLRRFLHNEPVQAKHPTLTDRAGRWVARHWRALGGAFALLGLALALAAVAAAQVATERDEKQHALDDAKAALTEKDIALGEKTVAIQQKETALAAKMKALGEKEAAFAAVTRARDRAERHTKVSEIWLNNYIRATSESRGLASVPEPALRALRSLYAEMAEEPPATAEARRSLMTAWAWLGSDLSAEGHAELAADFQAMSTRFADLLAAESPPEKGRATLDYQLRLATALTNEAANYVTAGLDAKALPPGQRALAAWEGLAASEAPAVRDLFVRFQAQVQLARGIALRRQGQLDEAEQALRDALARGGAIKPGLVALDHLLDNSGRAHAELGRVLTARGRTVEARAEYRLAVADWERVIALPSRRPDPSYLWLFAWLLATCPDAEVRDPARAVELADRSLALAPTDRAALTVAGVARLRAGDLYGAAAILSRVPDDGGDAFGRLTPVNRKLLKIAQSSTFARLRDVKLARRYYASATAKPQWQVALAEEFAELLGETAPLVRRDKAPPPRPRFR